MAPVSAAASALPAADLSASLTAAELDMTVEEYLKEQCKRRVDQLKEHMEGLVESFEVEAKKARTVLRDIASGSSAGADEAGACAPASFCDPFALVAIGGKFAGRVYKFEPNEVKSTWTIGRTENNDIGLTGDDEVSSSHAQISYEKKQFKLMDLGSTNGTFTSTQLVSAAKLKKKKNHVLKVGHIITFGACTFKWCYHAEALTLADAQKQQVTK